MDNINLVGPQGTPMSIGSWLRADPGPDYGARDVLRQEYSSNAFVDGGAFAFESAGVRRMTFPLIVPSGGIGGKDLDTIAAMLAQVARPGGYVDLQPDGVASTEAVRFDVLGGRVNHDPYSLGLQRIDRRYLTVSLDVQPYGYWPTWITLASGATMMSPGRFPIVAASVIGDAPGYARMILNPVSELALPSGALGSQYGSDFLAWSIGGSPSLPRFLGGSWVAEGFGAVATEPQASTLTGGVNTLRFKFQPGASSRAFGMNSGLQDTEIVLDSTYRGRYRMFGWFKLFNATGQAVRVSADVGAYTFFTALASANPVATIIDAAGLGGTSFPLANASGVGYPFQMVDLGELSIPDTPGHEKSNPSFTPYLRFFFSVPSTAASVVVDFAGAYLHPIEGLSGVIPNGLVTPSAGWQSAIRAGAMIDSSVPEVRGRNSTLASSYVWDAADSKSFQDIYYGQMPMLGASNTNLNLLTEERRTFDSVGGFPTAPLRGNRHYQQVTVQYRPRFAFLKGL